MTQSRIDRQRVYAKNLSLMTGGWIKNSCVKLGGILQYVIDKWLRW